MNKELAYKLYNPKALDYFLSIIAESSVKALYEILKKTPTNKNIDPSLRTVDSAVEIVNTIVDMFLEEIKTQSIDTTEELRSALKQQSEERGQ